jgi:hypothetical protein
VFVCDYDNVGCFCDGLAPVILNGKCGFIDKTGKEVVECQYDRLGLFSTDGISRCAIRPPKLKRT